MHIPYFAIHGNKRAKQDDGSSSKLVSENLKEKFLFASSADEGKWVGCGSSLEIGGASKGVNGDSSTMVRAIDDSSKKVAKEGGDGGERGLEEIKWGDSVSMREQ